MKPITTLSPCGTSLLTNGAANEIRTLVFRYANAASPEGVPAPDRAVLINRLAEVRAAVDRFDSAAAARGSAELNGLLRLLGPRGFNERDVHYVLATDTWLGTQTAQMAAGWIAGQGGNVHVQRIPGLQTAELTDFEDALAALTRWAFETLGGYRAAGYEVIFNLTGGFKSIQGFLQALAGHVADQSVYIFESGQELLRVPSLPHDPGAVVESHLDLFRRLDRDGDLPAEELAPLPTLLLVSLDDRGALSAWGEMVWGSARDRIWAREILAPVGPLLRLGDGLLDELNSRLRLQPDRLVQINRQFLALEKSLKKGKPYPTSLGFKQVRGGAQGASDWECYAWSDKDAKRLYGHFEKGGVFVIDKFGAKLR